MTVIKICGITNLDDAHCALDAGADMLGFIFHRKSPRYVEPERVRAMLIELRPRTAGWISVGVFVNRLPQEISAMLAESGLDLAQLSGDESLEDLQALGGRAYKAIRTAEAAGAILASRVTVNNRAPQLLLDANHPTLYGGSGSRADTSLALKLSRQCRMLLAGGLNPNNVAEAIRQVRPWGVDVSSGVESSPGSKDHARIRDFISAVRLQDQLQVR
jgi:phosphoribosylanthranilate isomerase